VTEEAVRRFKAWVNGDQAILPPYLRRAVFGIVLSNDPSDEDYHVILNTYKTSQSADGKEIALLAIGDVIKPHLVEKTLGLILSGDIPAQDIHAPCHSLATNGMARHLLWETIKSHWGYVTETSGLM
jgi:aminopeptidase 2